MASLREIDIEGHRIAALSFNEEKTGPPVVFIHGIMASVNSWAVGQVPVFDGLPWFSLSLPGHYPAAFPPGFRAEELTADMVARVLTAAIRELVGERPVILVGHSTGGFAALAVAAHMPEIARGLFCISGFAQGRWTGSLGMLQRLARLGPVGRAMFRLNLGVITSSRAIYRRSFGFYAVDRAAVFSHPEIEPFLDLNFPDAQRLDAGAMLHYFARMPDIDITTLLPRISAPTLVLVGDRDPIVPPGQSYLIAERVPDAELVVFEGIGHLPTSERTPEYHRVITDWIERMR